MKSSYKITLILVVVVCGGIITYYVAFPPQRPGSADPRLNNAGTADARLAMRRGADVSSASPAIAVRDSSDKTSPLKKDQPRQIQDKASTGRRGENPSLSRAADTTATPPQPGKTTGVNEDGSKQATGPEKDQATTTNPPRKSAPPTLTFGLSSTRDEPASSSKPTSRYPQSVRTAAIPPTAKPTQTPDSPTTTKDTSTPKRSGQTYTIEPGDTFRSIAVMRFGSEQYWFDIAQANPQIDPTRLKVGQVINLPDISKMRQARQDETRQPLESSRSSSSPSQAVTQHVVRPGEALYLIAEHYYNDPEKWRLIYYANRDHIGSDPDHVEVGTVLQIPPATASPR